MIRPTHLIAGDDTPVSGGPPPQAVRRDDLPDLPLGADELTTHLLRLAALHPGALGTRVADLATLGRDAKIELLRDFNRALGIRAFVER